MRVLVFGAGFSGKAIASALREDTGREISLIGGTTRDEARFGALAKAGMTPFLFDGQNLVPGLRSEMARTTHLIQSIAPDETGDRLLDTIGGNLKAAFPMLRWAGYLSTMGVYGDHGGDWVDEDTPCRPVSKRSLQRRAAEDAWIFAGQDSRIPVAVARLSGIYGPGRNAFVNLDKGKARRLVKPGQVFNRIHVADIAGASSFLMQRELFGLWNVTDSCPAPPQDIVLHAAGLMDVPPPPEMAFEDADLGPMARSFYGENKRVDNAKLIEAGYVLRFPDYRSGLADLMTNERWRG